MNRKPNTTPRDPRARDITVFIQAHRFAHLKARPKNENGTTKGGGVQRFENWCIDNAAPANGDGDRYLTFDPEQFSRLRLYIQKLGKGGPQQNLRDCFIPTFRDIGIELKVLR